MTGARRRLRYDGEVRTPRLLVLFASASALALACTELRTSPSDTAESGGDAGDVESPDGKGRTIGDASVVDGGASRDSGVREGGPVDAAPVCDGPCPPETLASGLSQGTTLTVDDTNVYFAEEGGANGAVYACPKTGCVGTPTKLGDGYAFGLAVLGGRVYWGDFSGGRILSCPPAGCANLPTVVAPNQVSARGVWTDGADIFWTTSASGGSIMKCTPPTCTPAPVVTGVGSVLRMTADQGRVAWAVSGSVKGCAIGACASPATLGPGTGDLSTQGGNAFWVAGATKNVVKCAMAGCGGAPLTLGSSQSPMFPVSDGTSVYWRDGFYDQIYRCPATGCAPGPVTLAKNQRAQPGGNIALDGQYVYWTTTSGVFRLAK